MRSVKNESSRTIYGLCCFSLAYSVFDADGKTVYTPQRVYTVVHGDSLWSIARKYLGDGSRYPEIVKLNALKTNVLYTGQKLKLPEK